MKIQVSREQFDSIASYMLNHVYSPEEWDPMKGLLFLECEDDQVIAEVLECTRAGQGRWLIIFQIIGGVRDIDKPISGALSEVPERPKRSVKDFAKAYTKPWHGYYIK